jgi:Alpha galactosidase A C-terminal beta sandwich domain
MLQQGSIQIWTRPILPTGSWAFAFLNTGTAVPSSVSVLLSDLGFTDPAGYNVTEVFDGLSFGSLKPDGLLKVSVNPTGVFFGKAVKL